MTTSKQGPFLPIALTFMLFLIFTPLSFGDWLGRTFDPNWSRRTITRLMDKNMSEWTDKDKEDYDAAMKIEEYRKSQNTPWTAQTLFETSLGCLILGIFLAYVGLSIIGALICGLSVLGILGAICWGLYNAFSKDSETILLLIGSFVAASILAAIYLLIDGFFSRRKAEREVLTKGYKPFHSLQESIKSEAKSTPKGVSQQELQDFVVCCPFCNFQGKMTDKLKTKYLKKETVWLRCKKCKNEFSLEALS